MTPSTEQEIEQKIQDAGLENPRLTPRDIDAQIVGVSYHVFPSTMKTICEITLKNGFSVTGEAGVVSPGNYNEAIGQDVAFKNAREKIWMLEGYLLKERLNPR